MQVNNFMFMIEIFTLGGYDEVGQNMTLVRVDNEAVIFDMGLHMESYIAYTESREDISEMSNQLLIKHNIVPDFSKITKFAGEVKAIIPTHAHLDHLGAVPFIAKHFDAPVIGTPFTIEVLKSILEEENYDIPNQLKILNINSTLKLTQNLKVEFINSTHSTPQTVMAALHTPYGVILYANDFKFDEFPTFGLKTNMEALRKFGEDHKVIALIVDSTYANYERKTPSESVAKEMLRDVMLGTDNKDKLIIATTFSSHIARLKSIIEFGKQLGRKIVFLGRSLHKYSTAAERINLVDFSKDVHMVKYSSKIKKELKRIEEDGREKYLLVVTGHQGEPISTLSKIASGDLDFSLSSEDCIIFSCTTIPTPVNIQNRKLMEQKLHKSGVRIFKDIHVSGHASREDLRDLINLVRPKHIIPAHGELSMRTGLVELAAQMGYDTETQVHLSGNGGRIVLDKR
jgi:ribonuclease J